MLVWCPGRTYLPALMVLAGIGVLFAGLWFWNDYSYWSCVTHQVPAVLNESCVSRPRHPHRLLGAGLVLGGSAWLIASLVAARRIGSRSRGQARPRSALEQRCEAGGMLWATIGWSNGSEASSVRRLGAQPSARG